MLLLQKQQSERQSTLSQMFIDVCRALDAANVRWCIVCGHVPYPDEVKPHDVDILVEPSRFDDIPRILGNLPKLKIAQCIVRESTAIRYETVTYASDGAPVLLSFDVFSDVRYPHSVLMEAEEFLVERERRRD